jgi:hypothetical protein
MNDLLTLISAALILIVVVILVSFSLKSSFKIFSIKTKLYAKMLGLLFAALVVGIGISILFLLFNR